MSVLVSLVCVVCITLGTARGTASPTSPYYVGENSPGCDNDDEHVNRV